MYYILFIAICSTSNIFINNYQINFNLDKIHSNIILLFLFLSILLTFCDLMLNL